MGSLFVTYHSAMALALAVLAFLAAGTRPVDPIGRAPDGWQSLGPPYVITSIGLDPQDPAAVYTTYVDPLHQTSGALRSSDFGDSWTLLAESLPGDTAASIAVDPLDSSHLFAAATRVEPTNGASRIYDSEDRGSTWSLRADLPEAVCQGFQFDRTHGAVYVLGCLGTLFASRDDGLSWRPQSSGLVQVAPGSGPGMLFATGRLRSTALLFSPDFGLSWTGIHDADAECDIQTIGVDAAGSVFYSAYRSRMIFNLCPGLFRSDDLGVHWQEVNGERSFKELAFDSQDPERVYGLQFGWASTVFDLEASGDGGRTWTPLSLPGAQQFVPSPTGLVLYASTSAGLRRLALGDWLLDRGTRTVGPRP